MKQSASMTQDHVDQRGPCLRPDQDKMSSNNIWNSLQSRTKGVFFFSGPTESKFVPSYQIKTVGELRGRCDLITLFDVLF